MASTVITDAMLVRASEVEGQGASPLGVGYFKIGEGGWELDGISQVPRTPDTSLTDLDCLENPLRYPAAGRYVFQKTISETSIQVLGSGVVEISCAVSAGEANDDGNGNAPEFWEIGIFTSDGVMLAYRTFDKQTKYSDRALRHVFRLTNLRGA
jgi:hypothetical protein